MLKNIFTFLRQFIIQFYIKLSDWLLKNFQPIRVRKFMLKSLFIESSPSFLKVYLLAEWTVELPKEKSSALADSLIAIAIATVIYCLN